MADLFRNILSFIPSANKRWLRVRRTPVVMQLEAIDCGAACLGSILAYFGCWVSLERLRDECGVGRDGSTLEDIAIAARKYGLEATAWNAQIHKLKQLPKPLILHWGFNHFVVLEDIANGCFYVNDPAQGHRVVKPDVFNRDYTGIALVVSLGPEFLPSGNRPSVLRWLWTWLREYRSLLNRTVHLSLLLALSSLLLPILLAIFVDRVLVDQQMTGGAMLIAAVLASGLVTYLLTWYQLRALREIVLRLSINQSKRFLERVLLLPIRFFAYRFSGGPCYAHASDQPSG